MNLEGKLLDQAIDPFRRLTERAVRSYDQYLRQDWTENRETFRDSWNAHYRWMDDALACAILDVGEEQNLKRREMNLALVGPGFHPVGNEISENTAKQLLAHLRSIVVIDFSQAVVVSAMRNLMEAGVPSEKLFGMQYDITNCMSTVYGVYIEKLMREVATEEQFSAMVAKLGETDIEWLKKQLVTFLGEMGDQGQVALPEMLLAGGQNETRTLRLTVQDEPLPIHLASYQMVVAGTGAAAEADLWERFGEVTSDSERVANQSGQQTETGRWKMYRQIHNFIAQYNTAMAALTVTKMIEDNRYPNSDAVVKLLTDVSTVYEQPSFSEMDRLHLHRFDRCLEERGIRVDMRPGDKWKDQPEHSHLVYDILCRRLPQEEHAAQQKEIAAQDELSHD